LEGPTQTNQPTWTQKIQPTWMQQKALKREQTKKKWPHCLPFDESKKNLTEKKKSAWKFAPFPHTKTHLFSPHSEGNPHGAMGWRGVLCLLFQRKKRRGLW